MRPEQPRPRAARRPLTYSASVAWTRAGFVLLLLILWEIYGRVWADPDFVKPPSLVVVALFRHILSDPAVLHAVGLTLVEVAVAFSLAMVVGLIVGVLIGWTSSTRRTLTPIVLLVYAIPQVVLLPLVVLIFGLGPESKIVFGFSHGVLPIVVNVVAGMRNVDPLYLRGARSMGAKRLDVVRHVILPHMAPSFFAGLRLAMTLTLIGVILAELYVSMAGIGYYTQIFAENFNPGPLFALIGVLAAIAMVLNALVRLAERRFTSWRRLASG
ncbi:MAG TPA: ABC transporter permease [Beijerinckiaceae bacterium]|nr:ABC transporter permease [Stellaceae bacterium]HVB89005.1 ABC transporter permease [Beijerinckiaceae bacterium]